MQNIAYIEVPKIALKYICEGLLVSNAERVDYQTDPSRYRHWTLGFDGPVATLTANFDENAGLRPGYKLKLNSYDLGVDIELNDAINRVRFEHPEIRCVVLTSGKDRVFCSGANIFMLGVSSHAWKVNFCKFTNETRNGLEDSSTYSGLKFLAAVNGACAGGGYELALACDVLLASSEARFADTHARVGVMPGWGLSQKLSRIVGISRAKELSLTGNFLGAEQALAWGLVNRVVPPSQAYLKTQRRP